MALIWKDTVNSIYNCLIENSVNIGIKKDNILLGGHNAVNDNSLIIDIFPNGVSTHPSESGGSFRAEINIYALKIGSTPNETLDNSIDILTKTISVLNENFNSMTFDGIQTLIRMQERDTRDFCCMAICFIDYRLNDEF